MRQGRVRTREAQEKHPYEQPDGGGRGQGMHRGQGSEAPRRAGRGRGVRAMQRQGLSVRRAQRTVATEHKRTAGIGQSKAYDEHIQSTQTDGTDVYIVKCCYVS